MLTEEMLVKHCSPTLAGIKTGNLFSCRYDSVNEMRNLIRSWNKNLSKKGVRVLPLRFDEKSALIYIYRPSKLKKDLTDENACCILRNRGYSIETPEKCIVCLVKRMAKYDEFPHEIGLFLGYPPEDVYGFIENKACNCKCCGCWKVYGDAEKTKKTFKKYKKCTEVYCSQYANGKPIERLTVVG